MRRDSLDRSNITIVYHKEPNYSMRDAGPIFLTNEKELMVADFLWNGYGGKHAHDLARGDIANDLARQFGWKIKSSEFAAEGGGLEVNEDVMLSFRHHGVSRNPG